MIAALLAGVYNKLSTYSATYKTFHVQAQQNTVAPYVTYGLNTGVPVGTFSSLTKIEDCTFWINCYGNSLSQIQTIADLVMDVMDNASLTVSGYTAMICKREFMGTFDYDPDLKIGKVFLRYRILISE